MASHDPVHCCRDRHEYDVVLINTPDTLALAREFPNYQYREVVDANFLTDRILSAEQFLNNSAPEYRYLARLFNFIVVECSPTDKGPLADREILWCRADDRSRP